MNDEKPEATPTAESSPGSPLTEKNERKLDLEIDNLKIKNKWEARGPLMPIAATLLAIAGFLFTVIQFQCGRASEQQKDRANRQAEQQRDRNLRTAEQLARCQDQLRLDSSELIKSAQEQRQTSSGVSFLLEDVRAALACKVNETQKLSDLFPDYEHALTEGLVNLVRDDYDFVKNPRDVSLANAIIEHWTDYTTYLKKEPGDLDYILYKYTDALQDLRNQNPGYMECLAVERRPSRLRYAESSKSIRTRSSFTTISPIWLPDLRNMPSFWAENLCRKMPGRDETRSIWIFRKPFVTGLFQNTSCASIFPGEDADKAPNNSVLKGE
jgi:hypothetical protein